MGVGGLNNFLWTSLKSMRYYALLPRSLYGLKCYNNATPIPIINSSTWWII